MLMVALLLVTICFPLQPVCAQESTDTTSSSDQTTDSSQTTTVSDGGSAGTSSDTGASTNQVTLPGFSYKNSKESTIGRSLILSVGLFPFAYFYTGIVINITRYVSHGFDSSYAPWSTSVSLTDSEMWTKIAISSAASLVFGLLGTILK